MNSLFLAALYLLSAPPESDPPYRISPVRATIAIEDAGRILVVTSPTGIGRAKIERLAPAWPRTLTLRLGIKGLEGFACRNERLEIRSALGLTEVEVRTRKSSEEKWSESKIQREPKLIARRKGEIIEVEIPAELLQPEAKSLEVEWVDFYRG